MSENSIEFRIDPETGVWSVIPLYRDLVQSRVEACRGRKMAALSLDAVNDELEIRFESGQTMTIWDGGDRDCGEYRYMSTSDDLQQFVGAAFLGLEVRDVETQVLSRDDDDPGPAIECQFLVVQTDRGNITFENYNEHSGYYGGFDLRGELSEPAPAPEPVSETRDWPENFIVVTAGPSGPAAHMSRQALDLLQQAGLDIVIVAGLDTPAPEQEGWVTLRPGEE